MSLKSSATTVTGRDITPPSVSKSQKLVLVLATSTLMTEIREETTETVEAIKIAEAVESAEVGKNDTESKGEYPNLA